VWGWVVVVVMWGVGGCSCCENRDASTGCFFFLVFFCKLLCGAGWLLLDGCWLFLLWDHVLGIEMLYRLFFGFFWWLLLLIYLG